MADIALQIRIADDPETVYRAISTAEGVAGWCTTGAEIGEGIGALHRLSFTGAPMTWDFRIDEAAAGKCLAQTVVAGRRSGSALRSSMPWRPIPRAAQRSGSTTPGSPRSTTCSARSRWVGPACSPA